LGGPPRLQRQRDANRFLAQKPQLPGDCRRSISDGTSYAGRGATQVKGAPFVWAGAGLIAGTRSRSASSQRLERLIEPVIHCSECGAACNPLSENWAFYRLVARVVEGSDRVSWASHCQSSRNASAIYFFSPTVQFCTTVSASVIPSSTSVLMRNRDPSGETSYWVPKSLRLICGWKSAFGSPTDNVDPAWTSASMSVCSGTLRKQI